jgi:serine/threonine protein phosphatase PrpC
VASLNWGSATHQGQIRAQNEDNLVAVDGVYVVADGMGGHEAGEVASKIAVERIRADLDVEGLPKASTVVDSISNANRDIFRAAIANPGQAGMGTTVTAIAVIGDDLAGRGAPNLDVNDDGKMTPIRAAEPTEALVLANVGDSRTYLLRHGRLRRVTVDHSYVQELVSTGHISEDEARTHPRRNIITRALGIEPDVKVDWWTLPLIRGDRFLLCSDGLVDEVADPDILETITTLKDPQEAAERLVDQANEAGGRDNITVIVVDVLEGDDPPDPTLEIDVVPLWADDVDPTPAGSLSIDADSSANALAAATSEGDEQKSDRGLKRFVLSMVLAAAIVVGFAVFASWARRGYYIEFNNDDVATIYKGQTDGVLWFDPTIDSGGPARGILDEDTIKAIEARPRFSTRSDAVAFITTIPPTSTTTTTTTTTNTTTTNTMPPTTVKVVAPTSAVTSTVSTTATPTTRATATTTVP